jgi:bacteriorhodopsin
MDHPKIVLAVLFLGYAAYSLIKGDEVIPMRYNYIHMRGMAALLLLLTAVCVAGFVTFELLDRCPRVVNPRCYRWLMYIVGFLGWVFLGLSLAISFRRGLDILT